MSQRQKGFSHAAILFSLVAIGALVSIGWNVYRHNQISYSSNQQLTSKKLKTYTDPSQTYSLRYPENWTIQEGIVDTFSNIHYLNDLESTFIPPNASHQSKASSDIRNGVAVSAFMNEPQEILDTLNIRDKDTLTINGYKAFHTKGTDKNQTLTQISEAYLITHSGITVGVSFIEKQTVPKNESYYVNFDDTNKIVDFTNMAKSVRFLK